MKPLRDRIRSGEITSSVRLWQSARVRVGGFYPLAPGKIQVTKLREISLSDITPELARDGGFSGVVDLLKIARHGPGRRVFLVDFRYLPPTGGSQMATSRKPAQPSLKDGDRVDVIGGTHKGKSGKATDLKTSKTGHLTITVVQSDGERFKTLAKNVQKKSR
ncbi:MAG TPA: hypothetical protein VMF52_20325 [Steroidobacteraceae bacterium]|nr:hypothetical protein [Steroidobacteraceae bacterium]